VSDEDEKTTEIDALLEEARQLDNGAEKIGILEKAVALADRQQLDAEAYDARMKLVEAAVFGGYPEKGLVEFSWCAAKSEAEPERFPESKVAGGMLLLGIDLLWVYKWMTLQVPWYPQLTRAQIAETLDDMEQRYTRHGFSLRPVYMQRTRAALEMGDDPSEHYRKWQWAPRDAYADCRACEVNFQIQYHVARGEHRKALELAEPLVSGSMGCAEVPHLTYGMLLDSVTREAPERGEHFHETGYSMVADNRDFVETIGRHAEWCAKSGRLEEAKTLIERHLEWAMDNRVLDRKMWFFRAAREVLSKLDPDAAVRAPSPIPKTASAAATWFDAEAKQLAKRFDERNGNDFVSRRVAG